MHIFLNWIVNMSGIKRGLMRDVEDRVDSRVNCGYTLNENNNVWLKQDFKCQCPPSWAEAWSLPLCDRLPIVTPLSWHRAVSRPGWMTFPEHCHTLYHPPTTCALKIGFSWYFRVLLKAAEGRRWREIAAEQQGVRRGGAQQDPASASTVSLFTTELTAVFSTLARQLKSNLNIFPLAKIWPHQHFVECV